MGEALWNGFRALVYAAAIAFLVQVFVAEQVIVRGESMQPTLQDGERMLVSRLAYRFSEPEQRDLITFNDTKNRGNYVKRILAEEGDKVEILNDRLYVNQKEVVEPYVYQEEPIKDYGPVEVPEGHYFVLGDNRVFSLDSRHEEVGFVAEEDIQGKVVMVLHPFDNIRRID